MANSVNKIDQTVSFEGAFIKEIPFPLGTQIRIMPDRVSEFSYKIPKSALFRESEQAFVWKVLPSQKLTQWKVTALQTSGEEYVFVTEGLSEESVIVRDARSQAWTEGQIVSSAEKE